MTLGALYRTSASRRPSLRIGLLLDGTTCGASSARVIDDIVKSNFARLELVAYNAGATPRPVVPASLSTRLIRLLGNSSARSLLLYGLYSRFDAKRHPVTGDPLAPVDCGPLLDGVESVHVTPVVKGFTHRFPTDSVERIRAKQLDVLVRFGFNILRGDILQAARYGVWSFHHGDNDFYRGAAPYFWELYEGNPLSGVILQVLSEELDAGFVLCKSLFATRPGLSVALNRYGPYWGSTHFVIRKLNELHQHGWEHVRSRAVAPAPYQGRRRIYRRPTNVDMARWLAPELVKRIAGRPFRVERLPHWQIAFRVGATPLDGQTGPADMRGFRFVEAPRGHYYADPFLISGGGTTWAFFEDFLYQEGRGVISCAEVTTSGRLGPPQRCVQRDYHLSYPMIFEHEREIFMIPESVANGTVELYRATSFPNEWKLEKVLHHMAAVDTTALHEDGRWWFFVTVSEPRGHGAVLLLFSAASLTGEWIYHPANPISTDVRTARGAGAILRAQGRLLRPSQDCTRSYGYSFALNEIETLTPAEYRERPRLTIEPSWSKGLIGTHTYNRCDAVEVVDGCRSVRPASVR